MTIPDRLYLLMHRQLSFFYFEAQIFQTRGNNSHLWLLRVIWHRLSVSLALGLRSLLVFLGFFCRQECIFLNRTWCMNRWWWQRSWTASVIWAITSITCAMTKTHTDYSAETPYWVSVRQQTVDKTVFTGNSGYVCA